MGYLWHDTAFKSKHTGEEMPNNNPIKTKIYGVGLESADSPETAKALETAKANRTLELSQLAQLISGCNAKALHFTGLTIITAKDQDAIIMLTETIVNAVMVCEKLLNEGDLKDDQLKRLIAINKLALATLQLMKCEILSVNEPRIFELLSDVGVDLREQEKKQEPLPVIEPLPESIQRMVQDVESKSSVARPLTRDDLRNNTADQLVERMFAATENHHEREVVAMIEANHNLASTEVDEIEKFKKIYHALHAGQSSFCKTNFLEGKEHLTANVFSHLIQEHIKQNPYSRTAKAWQLVKNNAGKTCDDKNLELVSMIHRYAYQHSSIFGFFKRSRFEGASQSNKQAYITTNDVQNSANQDSRLGDICRKLR